MLGIPPRQQRVTAEVAGWGRVVEHEWGFRAQYVQVVKLFAPFSPPSVREYLGHYYEVPVRDVRAEHAGYR